MEEEFTLCLFFFTLGLLSRTTSFLAAGADAGLTCSTGQPPGAGFWTAIS